MQHPDNLLRIVLLVVLIIATGFTLSAQIILAEAESISISNVTVSKTDNEFRITFSVGTHKQLVRGGCTYLLIPSLTDGDHKQLLPLVAIQSRKARIAAERREWAGIDEAAPDFMDMPTIHIKPGDSLVYTTGVPYHPWMDDALLEMDEMRMGCASVEVARLRDAIPLQDTLLVQDVTESKPTPTTTPVTETTPIAEPTDTLTASKHKIPAVLLPDTLALRFASGQSAIDPDMFHNKGALQVLKAAITQYAATNDLDDCTFIVTGYTSPEGGIEVNERLGLERSHALEVWLLHNTPLHREHLVVSSGGIDWHTLRRMVEESDMPARREVLHIIDYTPVWDASQKKGRLGELMQLNGGEAYHYMEQHFFPELRRVTFICADAESSVPTDN
ncbi:MAG: hypothetical protein LBM62_06270 [Mediterranea sp.]|jgi:outer membrane protein OmpA-like peptidoglycan-associated protein|nr:hypothetical protein [Mediterranea sp.]